MMSPTFDRPQSVVLQKFHNHLDGADGGDLELTAANANGKLWFKGVEAAKTLGYVRLRNALNKSVNEKDKTILADIDRELSQEDGLEDNEMGNVYISEAGLYSLVLQRRTQRTKLFQKWLTNDVLPSIREKEATDRRELHSAMSESLRQSQSLVDRHTALNESLRQRILELEAEERDDLIDATEFLRRKGVDAGLVSRLAPEFGRDLKSAWEARETAAVAMRPQSFGGSDYNVRMYRTHEDALFMEAVWRSFQDRPLYQRLCAEYQAQCLAVQEGVANALLGGRGRAHQRQPRRRGSQASQEARRIRNAFREARRLDAINVRNHIRTSNAEEVLAALRL